jgi:hypothetical protein
VFVPPAAKIPSTSDHPLALLRTNPQDETVGAVLQFIYSFDSGTKRKNTGSGSSQSRLDCPIQDDSPYEVNPVVAIAQQMSLADGDIGSHNGFQAGPNPPGDCSLSSETLSDDPQDDISG